MGENELRELIDETYIGYIEIMSIEEISNYLSSQEKSELFD